MIALEEKTQNPWTIEQRQIIAEILNEALTLSLDAEAIIGCTTHGDKVVVHWKWGDERQHFWFLISWFRSRVEILKKERELVKECARQNLQVLPSSEKTRAFAIVKNNRFLGVIGFNSRGWYITRISGNGRPVYVKSLDDAVLSLWMLEVAIVA